MMRMTVSYHFARRMRQCVPLAGLPDSLYLGAHGECPEWLLRTRIHARPPLDRFPLELPVAFRGMRRPRALPVRFLARLSKR